jgi:regulator of protease activity HflC (stomatin/prohibitin superfamily)
MSISEYVPDVIKAFVRGEPGATKADAAREAAERRAALKAEAASLLAEAAELRPAHDRYREIQERLSRLAAEAEADDPGPTPADDEEDDR